jgi:hypothetical protein
MRRVAYTRTRWSDNEEHHKLVYRSLPAWRHKDSYRFKHTRKRKVDFPPMPNAHEFLIYIYKRRHGLKYDLLVGRNEGKIHLYIHRV